MSRIVRREGDLPKRSLWQRLKHVALMDVAVIARGGVRAGSLEELEQLLLEADFGVPVTLRLVDDVGRRAQRGEVKTEEQFQEALRESIEKALRAGTSDSALALGAATPAVILVVGVNGAGKTTFIGKLAQRLRGEGKRVLLAAGDTFRAGAIEQLALHGERLGVNVVKHKAGADPAAVAYDAIEHAKARHKDVVLLDTAGRMQNNRSLMDEMDKVRRVANPDLVVFVGDSLAGNDAVEQARKFDEIVDIGGVILTKVDVDAKGGAALSVAYTINKPLIFVGVGQGYDDLKPFDAKWLVDRLFGEDDGEAVATAA